MAYEVYVYSGGAIAKEVFDAVSALTGSGDLKVAMTVTIILSVLFSVVQYIKMRDLAIFGKWLFIYVLVTGILIKPSDEPVQIIDASNPLGDYVVDNVPMGIVLPAHFVSWLLVGIANKMEDVYHTPDELDYSQTGMLFGAKVFGITTQSHLYDSGTQLLFNQFVSNCIIPQVSRGQYTFSDLANSDDLKTFFTQDQKNLSPLFGIYIKGAFQTCQTAWPILVNMLNGQVNQTMASQGQALFPSNQNKQGDLSNYVNAAYNYYFNKLSMGAEDLMGQNILANAIINGGLALSSSTDAMGAQVNYATANAMTKQQIAWIADGDMAARMLPLMQTVLFLLLVGIFPLIVMLAMIPNYTVSILYNYVIGFIYICSWPIFFDIINFIMNANIQNYLSSYSGITISNLSALTQQVHNSEAICGYLMLSVPFLPLMVLGLHKVITSVSNMMSASQGFTAGAASEAAMGNFSMGDTSMGNHSWNNIGANKMDTNTFQASGKTSIQTPSGAIATQMPDGNLAYDVSPAISHLPAGVTSNQAIQASAQDRYSHDLSEYKSLQTEKSQLMSDTMTKATQLQSMLSSSQSVGTGASYGEQSNSGTTASALVDHLKSYSQSSHAEHSSVSNMQTSTGGSAHLSGSVGMGVSGGINGHVTGQSNATDETAASLQNNVQNSADYKSAISSDISKLSQAATNTHSELSNAHSAQLLNDIQANWSRIEHINESQSASLQDAQSMQKAYELSSSSGFSINDESLNNLVLSRANESHDPLIFDAVTSANPTSTQREIRDGFVKSVITSEVLPNLGSYASNSGMVGAGGDAIHAAYASNSSAITQAGSNEVNAGFSNNSTGLKGSYKSVGSTPSYQSVGGRATQEISGAQGAISKSSQAGAQENQIIQSTVQANQENMANNAEKGAIHNLTDHIGMVESKILGSFTSHGDQLEKAVMTIEGRDYQDLNKRKN